MSDLTEALPYLLVAAFFLQVDPRLRAGEPTRDEAPAVAFVPLIGLWIVVFRSIGWTGWLLGVLVGLVVLAPYIGLFVTAWAGVRLPSVHRRSRWWIALLVVPVLNLVGYSLYAFTLPRPTDLSLPNR